MSKESALASIQQPAAPIAPQETPEPAPPAQPDAARFASIARKEAEVVRRQEQYKKDLEAFNADKEKVRGILTKAETFEELRKTDPVAALKHLGYSDTDIFNMLANQDPPKEPTPEDKTAKLVQDEIQKFKDDEAKKAKDERDKNDKATIDEYKGSISKFLETNKDKLEYCAFFGEQASDLAYEIILAGLKESKGEELIPVNEAFDMAESFYEEQDKNMTTKLKKRQAAEAPAPDAPVDPTKDRTRTVTPADPNYKQPPVITRTRTISNAATASTASTAAPRNETREQKRERLINQIKTNGLRK